MSLLVSLGVVAVALVVLVLELVRRRRLKERFASVWIAFSIIATVGVFFPGLVEAVANRLGFEVAANLVLLAGMLALALISLQLSVEVGRLRDMVERLTTRLAILYAEDAATTDQEGADPE